MQSFTEMYAEAAEKAQEALRELARLLEYTEPAPCSRAPYTQPERITAPTADQYQLKPIRLDQPVRSSLYHRRIMKR